MSAAFCVGVVVDTASHSPVGRTSVRVARRSPKRSGVVPSPLIMITSPMSSSHAFFGARLHASPTRTNMLHESPPRHFPLGTLSESPRRHERAPITFGACPLKLPLDKLPGPNETYEFVQRPDASVGPNLRAQPVVSVTRAAGYACSGYPHTLLMRETSQRTFTTVTRGAAALSHSHPITYCALSSRASPTLAFAALADTPQVRAQRGAAAFDSPLSLIHI